MEFTEPVLTYRTSRRAQGGVLGAAASVPPGTRGWQDGLPLTVYIDSAEHGLPAQVGWRSRNGAEGSVSFAPELDTFHGHWRSGAGQWHEYRGTLAGRAPARALAQGDVQRFATQASWGDISTWHDGQQLEFRVDTGDGPLDRLHWHDQRESCASIGFSFDGTSFIGWSQRLAEGPVAYRGTLIAAPEPEPGRDPLTLQPELEEVVKAVGQLADSAARRLSSWMNERRQDHS